MCPPQKKTYSTSILQSFIFFQTGQSFKFKTKLNKKGRLKAESNTGMKVFAQHAANPTCFPALYGYPSILGAAPGGNQSPTGLAQANLAPQTSAP